MQIRIASAGDNVVDCYLANGLMFPGGNTLNLSVHAQRLTAEAAYIGTIGTDEAGDVIAQALWEEGVDTSRLRRVPGPNAHCIIGHSGGDRVFVSFDLGVSVFELDDQDLAFLATHDVVHVGQSSGLDASLGDVAARTKLSYDFSQRRDPEHLISIAPLCFLSTFSGGDLSESDAHELAHTAITAGSTWALVTRGTEGAILLGDSGMCTSPAAHGSAVDTLGAGDTFTARTLVGLLRGEVASEFLVDAARLAAETCQSLGAFGHGVPISPTITQAIQSPPRRSSS